MIYEVEITVRFTTGIAGQTLTREEAESDARTKLTTMLDHSSLLNGLFKGEVLEVKSEQLSKPF